jgi:hypothetical protein
MHLFILKCSWRHLSFKVWAATVPETKNNSVGEGQQNITPLHWTPLHFSLCPVIWTSSFWRAQLNTNLSSITPEDGKRLYFRNLVSERDFKLWKVADTIIMFQVHIISSTDKVQHNKNSWNKTTYISWVVMLQWTACWRERGVDRSHK